VSFALEVYLAVLAAVGKPWKNIFALFLLNGAMRIGVLGHALRPM
jgi:ABC-type lipoprotein release transport system permease subunit